MSTSRLHRIRLRKGKRVMSTSYGNEIAEALNGLPLPHTPELDALGLPFGIGRIVDSGPNNEPDYPDERYYVQLQYIVSGYEDDNLDLENDSFDYTIDPDDETAEGDDNPNTYTVTNLPERNTSGTPGSGTHGLQVGTAVLFFIATDVGESPDDGGDADGTPARPRYVMCVGGTLPRGQYVGQVFQQRVQGGPAQFSMFVAHVPLTA